MNDKSPLGDFSSGLCVDFKDNGDASSQGQCLLGLVYG